MCRFVGIRWVLLSLFAVSLGAPRALPAQATDQPPATVAPAAASAPTTAPSQVSPEELGDSLAAHQRYQAAIAAYEKVPQMTSALWNKMGVAYQMMLNTKDATRCYRESLKLNARDSQVLNNLGTVYASLKDYSQADRFYRKAIKIDPDSALIYKNLGTNLLAEHKYNKGWEAYQRALKIDPQIFSDRDSPHVENPSSVQERGAMNYYMALGCVRAGYTDCALDYLRMALDEGFTSRKKVAADSEFASLRDNPAFQQLVAEPRNQ